MTDVRSDGTPARGDSAAIDPASVAARIFGAEGEMAARCRAVDWAATPLGPVAGWPPALQAAVRLMLATPVATSLWCGAEYTLVYNDAYRRILGVKHPSALGKSGAAVWDELWPALEPQFARVRAGGPAVYEDESLLRMERLDGGAGEDAWFTYSLSALTDDDGRCLAVYNLAVETTTRVRARAAVEAERNRLLEATRLAPSFVCMMRGPSHVFEYANEAYFRLVGRRDILGKAVWDALPDARGQGFEELLDRVLGTGEPFVGREVPIRLARTPGLPAEERFVDFLYQALSDVDGMRAGVIVHGTDVTEQVRARREVERLLAVSEATRATIESRRVELEHANARLSEQAETLEAQAEELQAQTEELEVQTQVAEEANRAKSQFLAMMSHELRTPLNAIGGYVELMEQGIRGPVTPEQRNDLARVLRAQRHLLGLINGVLTFARVDAGVVEYRVERVPMDEVLATCEALVAPQARARQLALDLDPRNVDCAARGDREKLQQVILNLLSNAVKFTGAGGRVALRCDSEGDRIVVRVSDTGRGIPAEQLERVFQPFVQVDARLTRADEGTGLGLAISRELARGMGGNLTAESVLGEGSTFTLTLPQADRPAGPAVANA